MSFTDRQKAFEEKFKHDQELQFRVEVRRNKLVGLWAAELLGKKGDEAEAYARDVISSDLSEPGIDDVVRKIMGDFQEANVSVGTSPAQEDRRAASRGETSLMTE